MRRFQKLAKFFQLIEAADFFMKKSGKFEDKLVRGHFGIQGEQNTAEFGIF